MSDKQVVKPVAVAVGTALAGSFAVAANADTDAGASPFAMTTLASGYLLGAQEGSCGEGKCGGDKEAEGSCGGDKEAEGSCGGDKEAEGSCGGDKEAEGSCGGDKEAEGSCGGDKEAEGKCGEGKCGAA
jgi:uncharacterized low-complexity protein